MAPGARRCQGDGILQEQIRDVRWMREVQTEACYILTNIDRVELGSHGKYLLP